MRISDWSSDVCSSDLADLPGRGFRDRAVVGAVGAEVVVLDLDPVLVGEGVEQGLGLRDVGRGVDDDAALGLAGLDRLRVAVGKIGRASCRERVGQYV